MNTYEEYPWEQDDQPRHTSVQSKTFKRHRIGTSRYEWNRNPIFLRPDGTKEPQCWSCGYCDYASAMLPVKGMLCCFSCWLEEGSPGSAQSYFEANDAKRNIDPKKGTRVTDSGIGNFKKMGEK
jgi:hypothetical protein